MRVTVGSFAGLTEHKGNGSRRGTAERRECIRAARLEEQESPDQRGKQSLSFLVVI